MRVRCAWCKELFGQKAPASADVTSFGICPGCLEQARDKARRDLHRLLPGLSDGARGQPTTAPPPAPAH